MYQPIPFPEFSDIAAARKRACDSRWEIMKECIDFNLETLSIIDLGAAEGYFSFQTIKEGGDVVAIEYDNRKVNLIKLIKSRYNLLNLKIIEDDLSNISLLSLGEFDYSFYLNIHQHIYKRDYESSNRILKELGQICKKGIFFETRPVKFHSYVEAMNPDNPQPFTNIDETLEIIKNGTGFHYSKELFYKGFNNEPTHTQSIPENSENIYRLFYLSRNEYVN
tara:strand:+ start:4418 stop:5083 length:666 start_codon:yes stop_codon:yes gene_type:complete